MIFTLNESELTQLAAMQAQAETGQIGFWQIYEWLANNLISKGAPLTDSTVLWLRGATEANKGEGAFSALIRGYTETQYQLRYGTPIPKNPTDKMQEASDAVAKNLIRDLLGVNSASWPRGRVPDISRIAIADASAVGQVLFNADPLDTAAESQQNSAWSGTLLFGLLSSDQSGRLIGTGGGSSIDTLNDMRDVLYAYQAYQAGLWQASLAGVSGFLLGTSNTGNTFVTGFATLTSYISNGGTDVLGALLLGTSNPNSNGVRSCLLPS